MMKNSSIKIHEETSIGADQRSRELGESGARFTGLGPDPAHPRVVS